MLEQPIQYCAICEEICMIFWLETWGLCAAACVYLHYPERDTEHRAEPVFWNWSDMA